MGDGWLVRLVGPLEVRFDGVLVPVPAAKQRVVLTVLALAAGEVVTVERLIACLWGDRPPHGARNTLQNHVLRLRRTLQVGAGSAGSAGVLVSSATGYRLAVAADAVDVHRFGAVVRSARSAVVAGDPGSAVALLDEALGLWRGEPLVDVPSEVLHREVVPGLVEQRLAAVEQRIDLDLERGRHGELITELVALSTEQPLRERFWAQLMLALYRSGRTAEALDAYRQAGKVLAEELGIDPGPELRELHQAVLTNDPTLAVTDPTPSAGPRSRAPRVAPRQLPAPTTHFVGRATEIRSLGAQLAATTDTPLMVISAIGGTAGIGKTALALHWAHQHADQFPDGQLYVNLRGFDPADTPLPPLTAIHGFLTALGVSAPTIPTDRDDQIALYRSHLAGRRMLILLDNARDSHQVRPLLPGTPGCVVLVTSRDQLAGLVALNGAVPLTLDLLTHDEAHHLLARRLGPDRAAREHPAITDLIDLCARLPLALNIAAAHAALHPNRPLAAFVTELHDTHRRLDALTAEGATADLRAVFSWSYQTLTPTTARVFRLLGVHPGTDISLPATANLVGEDSDTTRHALDELVRAHLIIEDSPGRYTLHDLLHTYAAELANTDDNDEAPAALRRVLNFYTHTACAAERLLSPHRTPISPDPPVPRVHPRPLADMQVALEWLDGEYANLLAAQQAAVTHGWHTLVWQLAWSMNTYQVRRGHRHDHAVVWRAALDATARLPDPSTAMFAHRRLGSALTDLGSHDEAIAHLNRSLALAEEHHDIDQQIEAHRVLDWAWEKQGDNDRAMEHSVRLVDLSRTLGLPVREATALNHLGWNLAVRGEFDAARTHCEAALAILRRHGNSPGEAAATLDSLGYIAYHSGHYREAVDYYQVAVDLFADRGHVVLTADGLDKLGQSHAALGDPEQARTAWRKALELYQQQGRDEAVDQVRRQLDTIDQIGQSEN